MHIRAISKSRMALWLTISGGILIGVALAFGQTAQAQEGTGSPLHPTFPLLDANSENVLTSGEPVSPMKTCGACHDTAFIAQHSFHADVGLSTVTVPGTVAEGHEWDFSLGYFGRWNPILYRYLSPAGDAQVDLTTAEWIQIYGVRHAGGGPAVYGRNGELLTELPTHTGDPETQIFDPARGGLVAWDWQQSGIVEMNCFLCHIAAPNNQARIATLQTGEFAWATSATLLGTGLIDQVDGKWQWSLDAFDVNGNLMDNTITIQDPSNENCGQCHGLVHTNAQIPLTLDICTTDQWSTLTTGQVMSPQRLSNSGLNLTSKEALSRSWDVHTERVVKCTDCHYALNNPIYYRESEADRPDHLVFDPRRLDLGEYLYRPLHQFAKGQSAQGAVAPEFDNTLRRCESCHSIEATHDWLPYKERHTEALSCETCHIPRLYAPALQSVDWTVLRVDSSPEQECRGLEDSADPDVNTLITGYEPVLLPRENKDGSTTLAPHNLITAWYWVYGDPARPVPLRNLQAVWLEGDSYQPTVLATFDVNNDGQLDNAELFIDSDAKVALISSRLAGQGLQNPRIAGEVQAYSINHNVTYDEWAIRDCRTCHNNESRLTRPLLLASQIPGNVMPVFVDTAGVDFSGHLSIKDDGRLYYTPETNTGTARLYILGHNSVRWIDILGSVLLLAMVGAVSAHSGLRYYSLRRRVMPRPHLRREYMYSVYERQWHWLQTVVILGLIFTGLVIHKPAVFGVFCFRSMVQVHNILALILLVNAALAAFYHLASGEIRQFLPQPHGFFNQAFAQALYYLRGIFRGEPHPFQKTPERKMNPLQQITYLVILNVLLPLQVITGVLMWGAQRWPDLAESLGRLSFLAPFHTLIAWLFASFIVLHVYLTTTGHTPLAGIRAMILGWDDVEVHQLATTEEEK